MTPAAHDTIAAVATAPGQAGIAIVRISGPRAFHVGDGMIRSSGPPPSSRSAGTFYHAHVFSAGQLIDDVIVLIYRAPHSYTREDVVEIQGHGGRTSADRILNAALCQGARLAEPGEFTKRAFLNGRLDLAQAEAVADLIQAMSDRAASAALDQLSGALSASLTTIYDGIVSVAATIEASLDFEDEDHVASIRDQQETRLAALRNSLDALLATWREGYVLREGARVVLCGHPNVGKSSLLNRLLGRERAIVTPTPGTTRDTIEETLVLDGYPVRLVDTAGLRTSDCEVEQAGIDRATASVAEADLILYVVDATVPKTTVYTFDPDHNARILFVINKIDLSDASSIAPPSHIPVVACSARTGAGIAALRQEILAAIASSEPQPHAVISLRHRELAALARERISMALEAAREGEAMLILAAQALREAGEAIGMITGRVYTEELLDTVFHRFCIGK